jgi:aerobic carbon-monoxide dehydrogenase large subunit
MSTIEQAPAKHVGRSLRRKEDPRLIRGRAQYVGDIALHGMLHAAIVRSPEAHARIVSIDAAAALAHRGIRAVYVGEDMADLLAPLPMAWAPAGVEVTAPERWPLARGKVSHVGEGVAMVVGVDKYAVVDAAQKVHVEYEPLPVVVASRRRCGTRRSCTSRSARTRRTSGRWAEATSSRRSPTPTS